MPGLDAVQNSALLGHRKSSVNCMCEHEQACSNCIGVSGCQSIHSSFCSSCDGHSRPPRIILSICNVHAFKQRLSAPSFIVSCAVRTVCARGLGSLVQVEIGSRAVNLCTPVCSYTNFVGLALESLRTGLSARAHPLLEALAEQISLGEAKFANYEDRSTPSPSFGLHKKRYGHF